MTEAILSGLLAGYGVAIPVGAIGVLIVTLTARTSFRVGAAAAAGVATADGLYAIAAVLGGASLTPLIEPVATPLTWLAALVLLAVAARTAVAAFRERSEREVPLLTRPGRAYLALLGLTVLNPATIIYFAALVLGRQAENALTTAEQFAFAVSAVAASLSWQLLLAAGGSLVGKALTGGRARLLTSLAASAIIAALAVLLVV
ncbi:LysE family transporter [Actinocorallia longicatena]|uniref:LysE family transporter n=1 Tax=Actinocorallia longicatena TaxID=111803 RepID=A0ABP6Q6B1_9ACTN